MVIVVNLNHIRQRGWYDHHYNDMDIAYPEIPSLFHTICRSRIYARRDSNPQPSEQLIDELLKVCRDA